ncbi:hypothetical protein [Micropruina sp.]|uniref:hypothetical protein n=1 Tax=Micropruina sp. TaxID=2737536 RepID=UPI0026248D76|nr:hypothetical protein [Micropruina sp.]
MSEVLTGKGPQPPVVYWIRRGLVVLVAVIVVGLLVWAFLPKGEQPTAGVPAPADTPTDVTSEPAPSPSGSPSDDMPTPGTSPSGSAAAPSACEPIGVQLDLKGFRSVKSGGKQTFSVTAENNTALPCVMEITPATFVLRVASGNDPVFSTAHCDKWLPEVKKQTLKAGAAVEFKVEWTTFRSAQGCRQAKSLLGAGTYVATAAYQESATKRFAFMLTKP